MLTFYGSNTKGPLEVDVNDTRLPERVSWIDAFNPTSEERARLDSLTGAAIPSIEDLLEIESSSRLSKKNGTLVMSLPATVKDDTGYPKTTPLGFVVLRDLVITVRFERLLSFENLTGDICANGELPAGGTAATLTLIEVLIDHIADVLERIGGELDDMSRSIFHNKAVGGDAHRPQRSNRAIGRLLQEVGRIGNLVSKVSETLLGLSRIAPFIAAKASPPLDSELKSRVETISADAHSLHEFQEHLSNKTQFLLDLLLGLANIQQNNVFRVLTVVSVVGIPPTLVASLYGMNFKFMPELEWTYGYAWGLFLIAASAIAPALWFKIKGWW